LACDAAHAQINALMNELNEQYTRRGKKIILVKYSAGCSMTQSPNDKGKMHTILHACFKSSAFHYEDV